MSRHDAEHDKRWIAYSTRSRERGDNATDPSEHAFVQHLGSTRKRWSSSRLMIVRFQVPVFWRTKRLQFLLPWGVSEDTLKEGEEAARPTMGDQRRAVRGLSS